MESRCFDRVILYSDIEEWDEYDRLKNVWPLYNDMAEDKYTVAQVCEHILTEEFKDEGSYDAFCCLLPTAPMRNAEDIKGAYGLLQKDVACEGVMGVTEFIQPWWQALVKSGEHWYPDYPDIFDYRQDEVEGQCAGKRYVDNGSMYWVRTGAFFRQKILCPFILKVWPMPYERSVDINTETDFEVAEFLASKSLKK